MIFPRIPSPTIISSTETTPVDRIKKSLADKRAAQSDPSQGRYPKG